MGISSDGLLWYGVAFEDAEDELSEQLEALLNGPDDLYGDGREWLAEHGLTGVEFVTHCSYDYPMHGIAVAGTLTRAYRGYPKPVGLAESPDPAPIIATLAALGLPTEDVAIGWHLGSMYG